jgi:hypothetical protein
MVFVLRGIHASRYRDVIGRTGQGWSDRRRNLPQAAPSATQWQYAVAWCYTITPDDIACEDKIMPETTTAWMYTRTIILLLALAAGGLMFYRMLVQIETMAVLMASMTGSMASMSTDISAMRASMEQLDRTVGKGAREMQQMNPMQMMVPGARQ